MEIKNRVDRSCIEKITRMSHQGIYNNNSQSINFKHSKLLQESELLSGLCTSL
jgi:hypothetical protein